MAPSPTIRQRHDDRGMERCDGWLAASVVAARALQEYSNSAQTWIIFISIFLISAYARKTR